MKNIFERIKEISIKHKKVLIIVLLLFLMIGGTVGYALVKNGSTNSDSKVTQNAHQNKNPDTNVTGNNNETKNDKKADEKKNDKKEVNEDKKSDTKVEETSTTETNVSNNTSNNTSTSTETTNNNVSNNTSNSNSYVAPTSTPCVPTYTTINHPEVGHYETLVVSQAWDEPVYEERIVGGHTHRIYNNLDEFDCQDEDGNYSVKMVQVNTIHHDAVTQQVWVVDQQAWTETVASGC